MCWTHLMALVATAATLLSACEPPVASCTTIMEPSVIVRVVDSSGSVVTDAAVTYTLNQGPERQAECVAPRSSPSSCEHWLAGLEEPGTFVITATSADGTRRVAQTVLVVEDVCHVNTQEIQVVLPD